MNISGRRKFMWCGRGISQNTALLISFYGTNELTIWRHGPNFRIDASATRGLHYHMRTATTGIGKHRTEWISEIIGGISGIFSAIN